MAVSLRRQQASGLFVVAGERKQLCLCRDAAWACCRPTISARADHWLGAHDGGASVTSFVDVGLNPGMEMAGFPSDNDEQRRFRSQRVFRANSGTIRRGKIERLETALPRSFECSEHIDFFDCRPLSSRLVALRPIGDFVFDADTATSADLFCRFSRY